MAARAGAAGLRAARAGARGGRGRAGAAGAAAGAAPRELVLRRPDDWHLHVRDGEVLADAVNASEGFGRAIVMPNLTPPVTTAEAARAYRDRIRACQAPGGRGFEPLMTLYLTDNTPPEEVERARAAGVRAFKLYPAGATTNSDAGVTDLEGCTPVLEAMAAAEIPLCVHGEVTHHDVDIFDREERFLRDVLKPLLERVPELRVVMEHITTAEAAAFVEAAPEGRVAATITPQHLLWNRNEIFRGGIRPHAFCLPVLKRERHRQALVEAVASGSPRYFLGTDSAPHAKGAKESACGCAGIFSAPVALQVYAEVFARAGALDKLEGFASLHGPRFYGEPPNEDTVTLVEEPFTVPGEFSFGDSVVVPICAGEQLQWSLKR